jgi:hypothetical protein
MTSTSKGIGPSFSYQFSFERRNDRSRVCAPGRELTAYAEEEPVSYT